ncbi:MAG TPA: glycerol-3-phosphate dehydrogenase, partial [Dehalococcoidia bacterium]|nr:glycerol-3-phosphate dehydrogenase [Dehalococcoidia bacterium]
MARIAIIGTTTWGTTLGIINARENREVMLLARTSGEARELQTKNENQRFVPGVPFPETIIITSSPKEAIEDSDLIIFAVPAASLRKNANQLSSVISPEKIAISATKGLEPNTGKRMTVVLQEEL